MKKHGIAAALLTAVVLLGPGSSAWAADYSEDTQHGDRNRCWDRNDWDHDGYNGDYKYRSYEGDRLQDHNRTGDDWRDKRCHRKCGKGERDWRHGHDRCRKHWHGDGHDDDHDHDHDHDDW